MKLIITAGGQGTKLWPLSREKSPKQFQPVLPGNETPFQYNVKTLLQAFPATDIYISTKKQYVDMAREQCPQIPLDQYFIEPDLKKGRGPAEGYIFVKLLAKFPNEPFMLVQVDDLRKPESAFLSMIIEMERVVKRDKLFITGGNKPSYPVLGVDYLQLGPRIETSSSMELFKVEKFVARLKDYQKTKELIENNQVVIHCNHMCWYPELIMEDYKKYAPDWYDCLMKIKESFGTSEEEKTTTEIYSQMREGTTEEVTLHSMESGYAVALPFKWLDLGTWDSIFEIFGEEGENYVDGAALVLDSENSLIKNNNKGKLIAVYGVKDLAIVDTKDVLLVMPRSKAEKLKEVLDSIKAAGETEFL